MSETKLVLLEERHKNLRSDHDDHVSTVDKRFEKVDERVEKTENNVTGILSNLQQIKWVVVGGVIMLVAREYGIVNAIKLIF